MIGWGSHWSRQHIKFTVASNQQFSEELWRPIQRKAGKRKQVRQHLVGPPLRSLAKTASDGGSINMWTAHIYSLQRRNPTYAGDPWLFCHCSGSGWQVAMSGKSWPLQHHSLFWTYSKNHDTQTYQSHTMCLVFYTAEAKKYIYIKKRLNASCSFKDRLRQSISSFIAFTDF